MVSTQRDERSGGHALDDGFKNWKLCSKATSAWDTESRQRHAFVRYLVWHVGLRAVVCDERMSTDGERRCGGLTSDLRRSPAESDKKMFGKPNPEDLTHNRNLSTNGQNQRGARSALHSG